MSLVGNIDGPMKLAERIRDLTQAGFKKEAAKALGTVAWAQMLKGFAGSHDPYGNPWERPKLRAGKPLIDSGQLRQSIAMEPTATGVRLRIGTKYAATHQYGATIVPKTAKALRFKAGGRWFSLKKVVIPKRQMFPEKATGGLGAIWIGEMNTAMAALVHRHLVEKAA